MSSKSDDSSSTPSANQDDSTRLSQPKPYARGESETGFYDAYFSTPESADDADQSKTVISNRPVGQQLQKTNATLVGEELVGSNLEHFTLEEFVGKGGMGAVFRATDNKLGRTVAVKVLAQHRSDPDSRRRFTNEAQSAARLDHPNIARVYYVGEDHGWHFIVFEYINGVNLRDLVEHKGPLPLDEAWSYVLQITDALVHASEREVVHRDIKPSNILVTSDGMAKLVDMGLARLHQVENEDSEATASGVTLGTFDYISPEQARDPRSTDVRSDIYSLGCTLYYMLTGLAPYPTGTVLQKLLSHSSDPPPNPQVYRNDLDDGSVKVLHKMLSKRPEDRYQRPVDIIKDVVHLADQLGLKVNRAGQQWTTPITIPQFTWLNQLSWALPILCLIITSIFVSRLTKPDADLVLALPTFSSTPYSTLASVTEGEAASNGLATETLPSELPDAAIDPAEVTEDITIPEFQTVIVGEPDITLPDEFVAVDTFDRALSLLPVDPEIGVIEIWEDLSVSLTTLQIETAAVRAQSLIIRGKSGLKPSITITLSEAALETSTPEFLRLVGGSLTFENLELRFQLPSQVRQQWSLFSLEQVKQLTFIDTSITIFPTPGDANVAMQDIAVFNFLALSESGEDATPTPLAIEFSNVVVRGSLTLVHNPMQDSFHFRWHNGIFVSDNWLLSQEIVHTNTPDILLSLHNVTAFCGTGVIRLTDESGLAAGSIRLDLYDSVLTTNLGTPLFLIQQPSFDLDPPLTLAGANLAIDNTSVVLERQSPVDLDLTAQYTLGQLLSEQQSNTAPSWFQIQGLTESPSWANAQVPTPDKRLFELQVQDFAVTDFKQTSLGVNTSKFEHQTSAP